MKMYDVEMAMCFTKNLRIMAPDAETAEMLAELIFKGTDALTLGPSDLDDFEALAIPAFGTDDDDEDDDDYDEDAYCDDELDEEDELPFDEMRVHSRAHNKHFLNMLAHMLSAVEGHNVHIHIAP